MTINGDSTGGIQYSTDKENVLKQAWMLHVSSKEWHDGPDLTYRVCCGAMVSSSDKRSTFIVGGKHSVYSNTYITSILKLRCNGNTPSTCHWRVIETQLKYQRSSFLALPVPADMVSCEAASFEYGTCYFHQILQIGDGFCDDTSNVPGCVFDGGDCCNPLISDHFCTDCICHETELRHSAPPPTDDPDLMFVPKECPFTDRNDLSQIGNAFNEMKSNWSYAC